jgi:hypothetical protein
MADKKPSDKLDIAERPMTVKKNNRGKPKGAKDIRPRYRGDGPNDEITDRVCHFLRKGLPRTYAAVLGGISFQTMQHWLERAKSPDEPSDSKYRRFALAIDGVEGEMVSVITNVVLETMLNTEDERLKLDAARWMAEHRFARHFTKYTKTEISGPDGEAIKVENKGLESLSTEELLKIAAGSTTKK